MNLYIRKILYSLIVAGFWINPLSAQTKIQVVSKSISKVLAVQNSTIIQINGEKANINVLSATTKNLKINISLISKNPNIKEAEADIKYCKYIIEQSNGKIIIANNFDTKTSFKEITSNLSAKIDIEVPDNSNVFIRNIYGTINLKDINITGTITCDFGQVSIQNTMGALIIKTKYTDISGFQIKGPTIINAEKADIVIKDISKMLSIKNLYGNIDLENINDNISIDCEMTTVNLKSADIKKSNCDFSDSKGEIEMPLEFKSFRSKKAEKVLFHNNQGNHTIKIKTTYKNITIK